MVTILPVTTTATIWSATPGRVAHITVTAGADAASVIVRDGGASGAIIATIKALTGTTESWEPPHPVPFNTLNLHATPSGTSPTIQVGIIAG